MCENIHQRGAFVPSGCYEVGVGRRVGGRSASPVPEERLYTPHDAQAGHESVVGGNAGIDLLHEAVQFADASLRGKQLFREGLHPADGRGDFCFLGHTLLSDLLDGIDGGRRRGGGLLGHGWVGLE